MIAQLSNGVWVVEGDRCHVPWIQACGRVDHDDYARSILSPLLRPGDVAVDVGAHWGSHTKMYQAAVGPAGVVVAIEPHLDSFECLKRNCPGALCMNTALGRRDGEAWMAFDPANVGTSHLGFGTVSARVPVTTLDACLPFLTACRLLKIDAEGAEPDVLDGGKTFIARHRPFLFIEVNPGALERQRHTPGNLRDAIERLGYGATFFPPETGWESPQADALCTPR